MNPVDRVKHIRDNCPEHTDMTDAEIQLNLEATIQNGEMFQNTDFETGVNCRSAMSHKAHKALQTVQVPDAAKNRPRGPVGRVRRQAVPASYDARQSGLVGPVLNQGQCGSCWTFSATGAMDGAIAKKTGKLSATSQQNLVDCVTASSGCNGGWMTDAYDYSNKNNGVDNSTVYPYLAKQQTSCKYTTVGNVLPKMSNYNYTAQGDETDLKNQVYARGVIAVAIQASDTAFQNYKSGVYSCSNFTGVDHGVLLVGYGTNTTSGQDYWIVKNSWGTTWGESGYVRILRNKGSSLACGLPDYANYPLI